MGDPNPGVVLPVGLGAQDLFRAFAQFMDERQRVEGVDKNTTKALQTVVAKVGRFDGRNITKFLRLYTCEMEVHQVSQERMIATFDLAVVPELREKVQELHDGVILWSRFEELLKDEFFEEDQERMTKRSFLEWIEQRPGVKMAPNELIREFEKKFGQLPRQERQLLDPRKTELFLQATDEDLEDKLFIYLADRTSESGFTNDWRQVKETVGLVAKQQRIKTRGFSPQFEPTPTSQTTKLPQKMPKTVQDSTLEELIKGIRDLKVEMTELKKSHVASSSKASEKGYVERCMWCDSPDHKRGECESYKAAIKENIVHFKDGRIRLTGSDEPLRTNFGKGGMKKLVEEQTHEGGTKHGVEAESYNVSVELKTGKSASALATEAMKRGAEVIRKMTGWDDPVDAVSIRAFLSGSQQGDDLHDAMVEEKRGRATQEEDGAEPSSKRRSPRNKEAPQGQNPEKKPSLSHPGDAPLPKEWWEKIKEKEKIREEGKDEPSRPRGKNPAYKLQSDIESSTDMKSILEEKILDAKIEFTLREALGIAKRDFHELIIDVIKRKRQMTAEAIMVEALDTCVSKDEEEEIGQVFAQSAFSNFGNKVSMEDETQASHADEARGYQPKCAFVESGTEQKIVQEARVASSSKNDDEMKNYSVPYWARATTETQVRLGDSKDPILALVDHGSEINIMSRRVYEKNKWPIDINHGWVIRAANNEQGDLYGACPAIKTKIGDVEVEQNFFVQNCATYPVILGQPYITAARMETRVLDDGSHYARIRSCDGKKAVQFLTVKSEHERHREQLREAPLEPSMTRFLDF